MGLPASHASLPILQVRKVAPVQHAEVTSAVGKRTAAKKTAMDADMADVDEALDDYGGAGRRGRMGMDMDMDMPRARAGAGYDSMSMPMGRGGAGAAAASAAAAKRMRVQGGGVGMMGGGMGGRGSRMDDMDAGAGEGGEEGDDAVYCTCRRYVAIAAHAPTRQLHRSLTLPSFSSFCLQRRVWRDDCLRRFALPD